jgi:DNA-binding NarL/FixJ family response regulator
MTIRILLADDHDVVRRGIRSLLQSRPDWEICGEARDGGEAVALAQALRPDVVVLDVSMPGMSGIEVSRQLRADLPATEVVVLTMHDSEPIVSAALAAGARAYVLKSEASRELGPAIEAVAQHRPFLGRGTPSRQPRDRGGPSRTLTRREQEVVRLLARGHSNREVAVALDISVKTVETHRAHVLRKLSASSVVQIVRYALRNRLVDP